MLQAPPGAGKTTRVPLALLDAPWLGGQPHRHARAAPARRARRRAAHGAHARRARRRDRRLSRARRDARRAAHAHRGRHRGRAHAHAAARSGARRRRARDLRRVPRAQPRTPTSGSRSRSQTRDAAARRPAHARDVGDARRRARRRACSATRRSSRARGGVPGRDALRRARAPDAARRGRRGRRRARARSRDERRRRARLPPGRGRDPPRRTALLASAICRRTCACCRCTAPVAATRRTRRFAPSRPGRRKVVLATSIAETSLTIEGVRVVVDCGLARVPRFSPRTGMTRLETVRVSRASADQRRGRAGRAAPGVCYRLWAEHEQHASLRRTHAPEILEADLAPLALELAAAGVADPASCGGSTRRRAAAFAQARELLARAGRARRGRARSPRTAGAWPRCRCTRGSRTWCCAREALGARRARLRPRRAAGRARRPARASRRARRRRRADRLRRSAARREVRAPAGHVASDRDALRRIRASRRLRRRRRRAAPWWRTDDGSERRVGRRRAAARARLPRPHRAARAPRSGALPAAQRPRRGARRARSRSRDAVPRRRGARRAAAARAASSSPRRRRSRTSSATSADQIVTRDGVRVGRDASARCARASASGSARSCCASAPLRDADPRAVAAALLDGIRRDGIDALPWTTARARLRERLAFLHAPRRRRGPTSPTTRCSRRSTSGSAAPHRHARRWPTCGASTSRARCSRACVGRSARARRARADARRRCRAARASRSTTPIPRRPCSPCGCRSCSGSRRRRASRGGRVPLTLHLLSPAHRPVQVTRDLAASGDVVLRRAEGPARPLPEAPLAGRSDVRGPDEESEAKPPVGVAGGPSSRRSIGHRATRTGSRCWLNAVRGRSLYRAVPARISCGAERPRIA